MTRQMTCNEMEDGMKDKLTAKAQQDNIDRLEAALRRIATPSAFFVATSSVDPEAYARMVFAENILCGSSVEDAEAYAEDSTRQRYGR